MTPAHLSCRNTDAPRLRYPIGSGAGLAGEEVTVKVSENHNQLFLPGVDGWTSRYLDVLRHTNKIPDAVLMPVFEFFVRHVLEGE